METGNVLIVSITSTLDGIINFEKYVLTSFRLLVPFFKSLETGAPPIAIPVISSSIFNVPFLTSLICCLIEYPTRILPLYSLSTKSPSFSVLKEPFISDAYSLPFSTYK